MMLKKKLKFKFIFFLENYKLNLKWGSKNEMIEICSFLSKKYYLSASVEIALRDKILKVAEQIETTNYDMCDNL
jgi:hypothetical protein